MEVSWPSLMPHVFRSHTSRSRLCGVICSGRHQLHWLGWGHGCEARLAGLQEAEGGVVPEGKDAGLRVHTHTPARECILMHKSHATAVDRVAQRSVGSQAGIPGAT